MHYSSYYHNNNIDNKQKHVDINLNIVLIKIIENYIDNSFNNINNMIKHITITCQSNALNHIQPDQLVLFK